MHPFYITGPSISLADIQQLESNLDVHFPEDYRIFLQNFNGGIPGDIDQYIGVTISDSRFSFSEVIVSALLGIHEEKSMKDIEYCNTIIYRDRFPHSFIGIGFDPGGNQFLLSCEVGSTYGKIYFWDHELEEELPTMNNMYFVADNFDQFISSLRVV